MAKNNSSPEAQQQRFTTETAQGAIFHTMHAERTVTIYPVQENELKVLGIFNSLAMLFFSVGSGLFFFSMGLIAQSVIAGELTDTGKAFVYGMTPFCLVLAALCYVIAIWAFCSRLSELERIRQGSSVPRSSGDTPNTAAKVIREG